MVLFGLLTMMTFIGPLLIIVVGRGGERTTWPPDRPIEWWVFGVVVVGYLVLLASCLTDSLLTLRRLRREQAHARKSELEEAARPSTDDGPGVSP